MEEKKTNELTDEALDAVTGGASWMYNEETGQYDVFNRNGECVASCSTRMEAVGIADSYTQADNLKFRVFHPSSIYER